MLALATDYATGSDFGPALTPITGSTKSPSSSTPVRVIEAREDIFLDGDEAKHVFEILSGVVCAYRLLPDGERHIISFYYPGDTIGYLSLDTYTYSAQAVTPVRVRPVPRAALERDMQRRPELARTLLRMATLELTATRDHLLCVAAKSAEAKLASFLLALSRRNAAAGEDPEEIRLPMTRLDIADYLGLTIETVSRTMSKFKRKRLIELPQATQVLIRNVAGLADLSDA